MEDPMTNGELLEELKDLLQVPEFEKAIYHKVQELKTVLREEIVQYARISVVMNPQMKQYIYEHKKENPLHFELVRCGKGTWINRFLKTHPPRKPGGAISDFFTKERIQFIVNYDIQPGLFCLKHGFSIPGAEGRVFDLGFVKHTEQYYTGVITERRKKKMVTKLVSPDNKSVRISDLKISDRTGVAKAIAYYLIANDVYYNHVAADFLGAWGPLLDNKLIISK